jgi:ribose transport system substrate-binding protein
MTKMALRRNGEVKQQWGGQAAMERYLRRFPSINAVFGINDPTTLGAQKAATKVGRNAIYFGSVDGGVEARAAVRAPGRFVVTAAQDPTAIGAQAGKVSVELFERRYAGANRILLPVPLVVRD